jgi:hypothetical protein
MPLRAWLVRLAIFLLFPVMAIALAPGLRQQVAAAGRSSRRLSSRRQWVGTLPAWAVVAGSAATARPAAALVKGSTPPPKKKKAEKGSCTTMDECEAVGEARSAELFADSDDNAAVLATPEVSWAKAIGALVRCYQVTARTSLRLLR